MYSDQLMLVAARRLGDMLADTAIHDEDGMMCNWFATPMNLLGVEAELSSLVSIGPELYSGSSGISLALGELFRIEGTAKYKALAEASLRRSLEYIQRDKTTARLSFFGGRLGIVYAGHRLCHTMELPLDELHTLALADFESGREKKHYLDLTGGNAGAIELFLLLHRDTGDGRYGDAAAFLADELCGTAQWDGNACMWPSLQATGLNFERPLGGFAHGTAGIASALFNFYRQSGNKLARDTARGALNYEERLFDLERENWLDVRFAAQSTTTVFGAEHYPVAWCHGAGGIGLAYLRGFACDKDRSDRYRHYATMALRTTKRHLETMRAQMEISDLSICHGMSGLADIMLIGSVVLNDDTFLDVHQDAMHSIATHVCKSVDMNSNQNGMNHPSLMLGRAGLVYNFVRSVAPQTPSILYFE